MSNLRDIRTPDHFKTFANTLRRNVSALNSVSLQRLQHEIAIALGARSLEAFYAQADQVSNVQGSNVFPFTPYVLVRDEGKGTDFLVTSYFDDKPTFSSLTAGTLIAVSEDKSGDMLHLRNPFVSLQPLSDALPELAALVNAQSVAELEKVIRDQHAEGALDCVGFWFDADAWQQEVSTCDTSRSYVEWVLSELEQWKDEQVSAYNATSQSNSTALYPYRVVVTEDAGDSTTGEFYCLAENDDHAYEQAEDAYPNGEAKLATRIDPKDYPYEIHPENNVVNGSQD